MATSLSGKVGAVLLRLSGGLLFCVGGLQFFANWYPRFSIWGLILFSSGVFIFSGFAISPFSRPTLLDIREAYLSIGNTETALKFQSRAFWRLSWLVLSSGLLWALFWTVFLHLVPANSWPASATERGVGVMWSFMACLATSLSLLVWSFVLRCLMAFRGYG